MPFSSSGRRVPLQGEIMIRGVSSLEKELGGDSEAMELLTVELAENRVPKRVTW